MVLYTPIKDLREFFAFENEVADYRPGYNVCPSQNVLAVRAAANGAREGLLMRWGLIPGWAKDAGIGNKLANARSETVHEKPSFRNAFKKRRCILPADGFYEWKAEGKRKQPYFIRFSTGRPFGIAGLWEQWRSPEIGELVQTATLLTTGPNALMQGIHDRMPVILAPADYGLWLDPGVTDGEALRHLLVPCAPEGMQATPVSTAVNSPRNQGAALIEPDVTLL
jgi:putative SOS response-associated peptidase YedK